MNGIDEAAEVMAETYEQPEQPAPELSGALDRSEYAPESYAFDLPEDFQVDESGMSEFKGWLAERKIAPDAAAQLMGMYRKQVESSNARQFEAFRRAHEEGYNAIVNHPDLGGENFQRSQMRVARALARFGGDDFAGEMKRCGMSNNLRLFSFLERVGDWLSEARPLASDATSPKRDEPLSRQFWGFIDRQ